jgi:hypothetical protein
VVGTSRTSITVGVKLRECSELRIDWRAVEWKWYAIGREASEIIEVVYGVCIRALNSKWRTDSGGCCSPKGLIGVYIRSIELLRLWITVGIQRNKIGAQKAIKEAK